METKDEIEETKITLIGFLIFGIFLLFGGIFTEPELDIETGIIWNEPVFHKMSKSAEFVFTIKNSPGFSHKIRSIYRDLDRRQKDKILSLKKGMPIEIHVNNHRAYQNKKEVYALKANGEIIYGIEEYEAYKQRERIGMIGFIFLFLFLFYLYTKSRWKENSCLIYFLIVIGMGLIVIFIYNG